MFLFFLVEDLQRWTKQVVKACLYRNFQEREREREREREVPLKAR